MIQVLLGKPAILDKIGGIMDAFPQPHVHRAAYRPQAEVAAKRVTILGSTGSVGVNTLDLVARNPDDYKVEALTAGRNVAKLLEQALRFRPKLAVIADEALYPELKAGLAGSGVEAAAGPEAVVEAAARPAEWVMAAIVGAAGLRPTLAALRRGGTVALANKEALVCAGDLVTADIMRHGATLLPVDSEHNAIFQVINFDHPETVERIILTASGGPFRGLDRAAMKHVTPAQAVAHPVWNMGAKISVDSATMMNKGLEIIEAHHLFGQPEHQIEVLIHPQSIVHSLVGYVDGSVLAQLGCPDMRVPIANTLAWPTRMAAPVARLDLAKIGSLTFEPPDHERFPALMLARQALIAGRAAPTILNAANEIAVAGFLAGAIGFLAISDVVAETLAAVPNRPLDSLDTVHEVDRAARALASRLVGHNA